MLTVETWLLYAFGITTMVVAHMDTPLEYKWASGLAIGMAIVIFASATKIALYLEARR